jgi:hypothetical protein
MMDDRSLYTHKQESAYPLFDSAAFSAVNDLFFFSGVSKLAYFTAVGMPTDHGNWGELRERARACETLIYVVEHDPQVTYSDIVKELESIYTGCLATAESLLPGTTPWPKRLEHEFAQKIAQLEVLELMSELVLHQGA